MSHRNTDIWRRANNNLEREAITKEELALAVALGLLPASAVPMERPLERREMTEQQVEEDIQREMDEAARVRKELGHLPGAKLPPYALGRQRGTIPPPAPPK